MQAGIAVFCFVFAVNSAVHSYLVLRYAENNKAAVNVGFYYMSNAAGRLTGTLLSGVLYSYAGSTRAEGFGWCFIAAAAFVAACTLLTTFLRDDADGLSCGCFACVLPKIGQDVSKGVDSDENGGKSHTGAAEVWL